MGTIFFDFLTDSFLFKSDNIESDYSNITDAEIKKELNRYREFCLSKAAVVEDEIFASKSNLKILSGKKNIPLKVLLQTAFYVEQYILHDPIFPLTREESQMSKVLKQYHGHKDHGFDKKG